MRRSFFVVGPESSGTRLLTKCLIDECGVYGSSKHKQPFDNETNKPKFSGDHSLIVLRRSQPHGHVWVNTSLIYRAMQAAHYNPTILITSRDWNCVAQSQLKNRHVNSISEAYENIRRAYTDIFDHVRQLKCTYILTTYEELWRKGYRKWLYGELGLGHTLKLNVQNEDIKYYSGFAPDGYTIWLTGLPCSGKTTVARALQLRMREKGRSAIVLDGDVLREAISSDLGFTKEDRDKQVNRTAHLAKMLNDNGAVAIVALVSPYAEAREKAKELIGNCVEVFVNTPLAVCEQRDSKGMYEKARKGEIKGFTGIDDPYEQPVNADVTVHAGTESIAKCVGDVVEYLKQR